MLEKIEPINLENILKGTSGRLRQSYFLILEPWTRGGFIVIQIMFIKFTKTASCPCFLSKGYASFFDDAFLYDFFTCHTRGLVRQRGLASPNLQARFARQRGSAGQQITSGGLASPNPQA
jgi:hypothetical protein